MNTAYGILVIILSTFLAIFIGLAIAATILIIKLVNSLRAIAAKGEIIADTAADTAEELAETIRRNTGAVSVLKIFTDLMNRKRK